MTTNELKKGAKITLRNGWEAEIADNARGNTRIVKVYGDYTEPGSVYAHDIATAWVDGKPVVIEHTPAQLKLREQVRTLGL